MKLSKIWIEEFIDFSLASADELVQKIGSQIGEVESSINLAQQYKNVIIVKVESCSKHPDSDHLNICLINDNKKITNVKRNEDGLVQVVCGAPNVVEGMLAVWLPPGVIVPATYNTNAPLELSVRNLRGVESNGMLASPAELGIGDNHDGILEIDSAVGIGSLFAEQYKLNDLIIDIENKMLTHRPDCFGQLGLAREVAGIYNHQFTSPNWYKSNDMINKINQLELNNSLSLSIHNEIPELVPRFSVVILSNIDGHQHSPLWLQTYLSRTGIRPINLIVDITNYLMILTGQPLHAYDYDKVKALSNNPDAPTMFIRSSTSHEKLTLLNGKEIVPRNDAILIATDKLSLGLGGIMGGADSEIDNNTKNIILESASFDMYNIRRTSMAHGIFSEAVSRFNKGQSPLQCTYVLAQAVELITKLSTTSVEVASHIIDDNHLSSEIIERNSFYPPVKISTDFINNRLGSDLSTEEISTILSNVEFKVEKSDDNSLIITAPFWRMDISVPEDLVEEVGRLYDYNRFPLKIMKRDMTPVRKDPFITLKNQIRDILSAAGANELLTYSFVSEKLIRQNQQSANQAFQLSNALSPMLQYYRMSLIPSLAEKVHPNIKAGFNEFIIYEIGKIHQIGNSLQTDNELPVEDQSLALIYAKKDNQTFAGAAFYQVRKYLDYLSLKLGIKLEYCLIDHANISDPKYAPFDPKRSAQIFIKGHQQPLGIIGEFKISVIKALKLPILSAGFEIDLAVLSRSQQLNYINYKPLSKYPNISQDVCWKVSSTVSYGDFWTVIVDELNKNLHPNQYFQIIPLDIYQSQNNPEFKQYTFRLTGCSFEKTLKVEDVQEIIKLLTSAVKLSFNAEIV